MQKLKAWFGVFKQSYSCILGIVINVLILLAIWLGEKFPNEPGSWFPPTWLILLFLFIGLLMPIGLGLAIRDYLKEYRSLALIGFLLCCWPLLLGLKNLIADWLTT